MAAIRHIMNPYGGTKFALKTCDKLELSELLLDKKKPPLPESLATKGGGGVFPNRTP